jgi:hypothetical protein
VWACPQEHASSEFFLPMLRNGTHFYSLRGHEPVLPHLHLRASMPSHAASECMLPRATWRVHAAISDDRHDTCRCALMRHPPTAGARPAPASAAPLAFTTFGRRGHLSRSALVRHPLAELCGRARLSSHPTADVWAAIRQGPPGERQASHAHRPIRRGVCAHRERDAACESDWAMQVPHSPWPRPTCRVCSRASQAGRVGARESAARTMQLMGSKGRRKVLRRTVLHWL